MKTQDIYRREKRIKKVKLSDAEKFNNSDNCEVLEYPLNDPDINCATAIITGRYPDNGYCVNEKCKELIYVIDGKGDVILIEKGEIYFWEANCKIVMPCTPEWYPEQHKMLEEKI